MNRFQLFPKSFDFYIFSWDKYQKRKIYLGERIVQGETVIFIGWRISSRLVFVSWSFKTKKIKDLPNFKGMMNGLGRPFDIFISEQQEFKIVCFWCFFKHYIFF